MSGNPTPNMGANGSHESGATAVGSAGQASTHQPRYELCVIEGDGIGHEVIPAALRVLRLVLPNVIIHHYYAGWDVFQREGTPLDDAVIETAQRVGAVLFTSAQSPSYPVEGYYVPSVRLRRSLQVYANLRPTRYYPVPSARENVNLLVVRENTEDVYAGTEHVERDAAGGSIGVTEKIISETATRRVAHKAFELAVTGGRRKVTIVHKASVMPQSDGLFRKVALEVAAQYPEIYTDELLVDTAAYWMVKDPARFDVVLTPNLYGDILSDMAAAWGGGIGLAPSLSIGEQVAIAAPVHGCAPDIAGKNIANPSATILSLAMLLSYHWGRRDLAWQIEAAIRATLHEGSHTADIDPTNALSTTDFTDRICAHLTEIVKNASLGGEVL
ncbi:MAG: isocitrate/isopropylmalate dehydrogenase family protein [Anaerolinea sp.]|nr:isocitrate/isopropylmalate dehydrogenase family protein [Anaerolinea sp.]